ncbi:MAG: histidine--tRNA ligase [Candidatus Nealsonbacteria bacterium]|nr:histidine--tRNA ligase [Candidatus Nealsonbacteria bacterium]
MKKIKFQRATGTHDILPFDQKYFKKVSDILDDVAEFYGFGKLDTPIIEEAELFVKGVGADTDIAQKEMYALKTKGGDHLVLRPEGTAPIVRAYIEHGMMNRPQPIRLYYFGPFFRYERPQAGRYRQFWQYGLEVFGEDNPIADAQLIQIFYGILADLKIENVSIEINSIGDKECRPAYRKVLVKYLKSKASSLCVDCKKRVKENPLRVLDCKQEKCQKIKEEAPQMIDHLCLQCHQHFKKVLEYLDEIELPYHLSPHLVRGLDYYNRTVFEFFTTGPEGKSLALGGGGRYDGLVKLIGGKDVPAIGGAFGVERIIQIIKGGNFKEQKKPKERIFLAQLGDMGRKKTLGMVEEFRKAKISVSESFGKDSLKIQMARAAKVGAKYTLIVGQKEALDESVIIRDMDTGKQDTVKIVDATAEVKKRLKDQ